MIFYCEPVSFAPGLYFAAGQKCFERDRINGTGVGSSPELAQARCRAEIAEGIALRGASRAVRNKIQHHPAAGIAAGLTVAAARARATSEAWERFAVNRWWHGRRAKKADQFAQACVEQCFQRWQRLSESNVRLLDLNISMEYACYLVCAENSQYQTCVFGVAADRNRDDAVIAAARELIQMEMGLEIILHRHRHGRQLVQTEQQTMQRAMGLHAVRSALFATEQKHCSENFQPYSNMTFDLLVLQNESPSVVAVMLTAPVDSSSDSPGIPAPSQPWHQWSPY